MGEYYFNINTKESMAMQRNPAGKSAVNMDADEFESFQSVDFEGGQMNGNEKKNFSSPTMADPIADMILSWYKMIEKPSMSAFKFGALGIVPGAILIFCLFISNTVANTIAFMAFATSCGFIIFSIWLLGSILDNSTGTKAMQDVADPIREGSEGFFITQYGTI